MASVSETKPVNKGAAKGGAHDRVAMLSVKSDGSPDQYDPELIGDKDAAEAATKEQFKQQAVSAADQEIRGVEAAPGYEVSDKEDPQIEKLQKAHESAAKSAEGQAKSAVSSLHAEG